jgi:hypothetical protein
VGLSDHHDRAHGGVRRDHDDYPAASPSAFLLHVRGDCLAEGIVCEADVLLALWLATSAAYKDRCVAFFVRAA